MGLELLLMSLVVFMGIVIYYIVDNSGSEIKQLNYKINEQDEMMRSNIDQIKLILNEKNIIIDKNKKQLEEINNLKKEIEKKNEHIKELIDKDEKIIIDRKDGILYTPAPGYTVKDIYDRIVDHIKYEKDNDPYVRVYENTEEYKNYYEKEKEETYSPDLICYEALISIVILVYYVSGQYKENRLTDLLCKEMYKSLAKEYDKLSLKGAMKLGCYKIKIMYESRKSNNYNLILNNTIQIILKNKIFKQYLYSLLTLLIKNKNNFELNDEFILLSNEIIKNYLDDYDTKNSKCNLFENFEREIDIDKIPYEKLIEYKALWGFNQYLNMLEDNLESNFRLSNSKYIGFSLISEILYINYFTTSQEDNIKFYNKFIFDVVLNFFKNNFSIDNENTLLGGLKFGYQSAKNRVNQGIRARSNRKQINKLLYLIKLTDVDLFFEDVLNKLINEYDSLFLSDKFCDSIKNTKENFHKVDFDSEHIYDSVENIISNSIDDYSWERKNNDNYLIFHEYECVFDCEFESDYLGNYVYDNEIYHNESISLFLDCRGFQDFLNLRFNIESKSKFSDNKYAVLCELFTTIFTLTFLINSADYRYSLFHDSISCIRDYITEHSKNLDIKDDEFELINGAFYVGLSSSYYMYMTTCEQWEHLARQIIEMYFKQLQRFSDQNLFIEKMFNNILTNFPWLLKDDRVYLSSLFKVD